MAFSVKFYNISDPQNKLIKDTGSQIHECSTTIPYEPFSPLTGKIIIDYDSQVDGANYCLIEEGEVKTYYFITDYNKVQGHKLEMFLKRDVLMTYNKQIQDCTIIVTRCTKQANADSESGYNSMLHDSEIPLTCQRTYREFPFEDARYNDGKTMKLGYDQPIKYYVLGVIG